MPDKLSGLRECHRVLKQGGLIAGYVIYAPDDLSDDERELAAELGPSEVLASEDPGALARRSGFESVRQVDVTTTFGQTAQRLADARIRMEAELREIEGDAYDEELRGKRDMVIAIRDGLVRRCLLIARKH